MTKTEQRRQLVYDALKAGGGGPLREEDIAALVRKEMPMCSQNLQIALFGLLKQGMVRPSRVWREGAHRWATLWELGSLWNEEGGGQ